MESLGQAIPAQSEAWPYQHFLLRTDHGTNRAMAPREDGSSQGLIASSPLGQAINGREVAAKNGDRIGFQPFFQDSGVYGTKIRTKTDVPIYQV